MCRPERRAGRLPLSDVEQGHALGQRLQQRRARMFGQQMAHSGLVGPRQFQKQLQHGHHQACPSPSNTAPTGVSDGTPGQTEGQQCLAVALNRAQPQVMGMLEHRQAFTAIELHSELGDNSWKRGWVCKLSRICRASGRVSISMCLIDAGAGAQHQIAHVVASGSGGAKSSGQQTLDQRRLSADQSRESANSPGWSPRSRHRHTAGQRQRQPRPGPRAGSRRRV